MQNNQSLPIFNSFVARLASVYNNDNKIEQSILNQDPAYLATKDRIESFLEVVNDFDLVQTYSVFPDDGKWTQDVVDALMSNDYKTIIDRLKVDVVLERPTVIQVILDNVISDQDFQAIQGGIILAMPTVDGIDVHVSVFTSEGQYELGISHISEKFSLKNINGENVFVANVDGVEQEVKNDKFSTFLLMQIPYFLALQADGYEEAYTKIAMKDDEDVDVIQMDSSLVR